MSDHERNNFFRQACASIITIGHQEARADIGVFSETKAAKDAFSKFLKFFGS
jgi:hypothetical protein